MKIALDTNVLAYAEGINDAERRDAALKLLERVPQSSIHVPVQALGELYNVLVRKAGRTVASARQALFGWCDAFALLETTPHVLLSALDVSSDHQLGIWDAIMVASAAEGDCRLLLSEDLQDGFTWRGVTVVNPFAATRHPLLDALLASSKTEAR